MPTEAPRSARLDGIPLPRAEVEVHHSLYAGAGLPDDPVERKSEVTSQDRIQPERDLPPSPLDHMPVGSSNHGLMASTVNKARAVLVATNSAGVDLSRR